MCCSPRGIASPPGIFHSPNYEKTWEMTSLVQREVMVSSWITPLKKIEVQRSTIDSVDGDPSQGTLGPKAMNTPSPIKEGTYNNLHT